MGQSIAGQINQLPIDMNGNVLTGSDPREMDGTFNPPVGNFPGAVIDQPMLPPPGNYTGGMPGMGGKSVGGNFPGAVIDQPMLPPPGNYTGGAPGMGGKGGGGPLAQIPIDMNGNLLGGGQPPMPMPEPTSMAGLPPAPNAQIPLGKVSGGTLGRPSASAPMIPRGPGFNNPGAPGAPPPQLPERGMLTPPQGPQNRLQPAPAAPTAPTVSQRARVPRQAPQSMKGGMARGAGRGGVLR